jgi:ATP-dependent RNA helicase RhlE
VFSRTKHGADKIVRQLAAAGIAAGAIHGNKSQPQRERAIAAFKSGQMPVLIATDIAARGIDIPGVSHVVNFDLPDVPSNMSTASAAPRAPAPRASRSPSAAPTSAAICATSSGDAPEAAVAPLPAISSPRPRR